VLIVKVVMNPIVVLKYGSSTVATDGAIAHLVRGISSVRRAGFDVIVVSSGAVRCGCQVLAWHERPTDVRKLQVAAAVGQPALLRRWQGELALVGLIAAQVLVSRVDCIDGKCSRHLGECLRQCLKQGNVVPIVNENDSVDLSELRFGDNDQMSAYVASLLGAKWLVLASDVSGWFSADPRVCADATLIPRVAYTEWCAINAHGGNASDDDGDGGDGDGGGDGGRTWGCGGVATKLQAAKYATTHACDTLLTHGHEMYDDVANVIAMLVSPENESSTSGTHFVARRLET
jgi:glutamate 5-kinase